MSTEPLVSVIIPTFNRAHCVGRAIESALRQTHAHTEVLVLDDGSTDGTGEGIAAFYGSEPRVRYFYHENRGVTATRNRGIGLARGDFVALLDSDDAWEPWKLELQVACFRHRPEIGMVWTDMAAVGPQGEVVSRSHLRTMYGAYRWFSRDDLFTAAFPLRDVAPGLDPVVGDRCLYTGDIFSQMVMGNLVHTSTVMIRRERLDRVGGFNPEFAVSGEDYDFHLRTCREGPVGFVDLATIAYQTGMPDRLTGRAYRVDAARNCLATVLPVLEHDRARIRLPEGMISDRLAEVYGWLADALLEVGDLPGARRHLVESLRHRPLQPAVLRRLAVAALPRPLGELVRRLAQAAKRRGARPRAEPSPSPQGRPPMAAEVRS
jgi:GT2 family glycosyltransferase